jgi:hypothetical protein
LHQYLLQHQELSHLLHLHLLQCKEKGQEENGLRYKFPLIMRSSHKHQ